MTQRQPFAETADGVRLAVRLTPKASAERIIGLADEADGGVVLKVAVTAAPEGGKANAALLKVLARAPSACRRAISPSCAGRATGGKWWR